jgi:hypothetical protein
MGGLGGCQIATGGFLVGVDAVFCRGMGVVLCGGLAPRFVKVWHRVFSRSGTNPVIPNQWLGALRGHPPQRGRNTVAIVEDAKRLERGGGFPFLIIFLFSIVIFEGGLSLWARKIWLIGI